MRTSTITGVIAASVLALAGCSPSEDPSRQAPGHGTPPPPSAVAPAENSSDGPERTNTDLRFAQQMLAHHEMEKQLLEIALKNADDEQIRSLAERIESENAHLQPIRDWLTSQGHEVGSGQVQLSELKSALRKLEEAQAGQFARLWLDAMVTHHEGVIDSARTETEKGTSPELKQAAQQILQSRQAQLEELEKLREQL